MTSLSTAAESLRVEGNLHEAKHPASAETELSAGTAENGKEPETSMQMRTARSENEVTLPSDRENGVMHTGAE